MLDVSQYVVQVNEIALRKLFTAYVMEVRVAMAKFRRESTHE
jgi:hypothetical protein